MVSMKVKFGLSVLIVGLLSACASQTTQTPASQPTEKVVSVISSPQATEAPVNAPAAANTSAPAVENTLFCTAQQSVSQMISCHSLRAVV